MRERAVGRAVPMLLGAAALCFGAVYPWGYWPLVVAAIVIGAAGIRSGANAPLPRGVSTGLVVVGLAIAVQLIPIPRALLVQAAPETHALLSEYDVAYAASSGAHALSIEPHATAVALTCYLAFALLLAGVAAVLGRSASALRQIVGGLAAVGAGLGILGIIQNATFNGLVLWFWRPLQWQPSVPGEPFGPFVNRNHFAGWMLMALPLVLGYAVGRCADGLKREGHNVRNMIVWFGSPAAAGVLLLVAACAGMTLSVVFTLSRAGILGVLGAGAVFVAVLSTRTRGAARMLALTSLAMMFFAAFVQAGANPILTRFGGAASSLEARSRIWDVALAAAARFWPAGTGINTFGVMTLLTDVRFQQHFSEAHNDYLQMAAEGGLLIGVPVIGLIATVLVTIRRRMRESGASRDIVARWVRFGAVISLGAIAVQEAVDFSLHIPANAALFAVVLAIALHRSPATRAHA